MVASVREGLAFLFKRPIFMGAITLDLFAVLFGGAVAILPIFAAEILHVGPAGPGRAARRARDRRRVDVGVHRAAPAGRGASGRTFLLRAWSRSARS